MTPYSKDDLVIDFRPALGWVYAGAMAVLTAVAQTASTLEPDRLIWMLGFAGSVFGVALLPSPKIGQSVVKILLGSFIAGTASTSLAASHYAPAFVNAYVAALWLGFAGPALFVASVEGNAFIARFTSKGRAA